MTESGVKKSKSQAPKYILRALDRVYIVSEAITDGGTNNSKTYYTNS